MVPRNSTDEAEGRSRRRVGDAVGDGRPVMARTQSGREGDTGAQPAVPHGRGGSGASGAARGGPASNRSSHLEASMGMFSAPLGSPLCWSHDLHTANNCAVK